MSDLQTYTAEEFVPGKEGYFVGLPEPVYRAAPGVNISPIPWLRVSPEHYKWHVDHPDEPTEDMEFGTVLHCGILEPHRLHEAYVVKPFDTYATKEAKLWRDAQTVPILSAKKVETLKAMLLKAHRDPDLVPLLESAQREVSGFKIHRPTGLLLKGRADLRLVRETSELYDLKKLGGKCASLDECSRRISDLDYHQQAAHYCWLFDADTFCFLFFEDEPPYGIGKYYLNASSLLLGARVNAAAYLRIAECRETSVWPGYPVGFREIGLTRWKEKQEANDMD